MFFRDDSGIPLPTRRGQSNPANTTLNPTCHTGMGTPPYNLSWVLTSLHPKQDVDPFSRFCTTCPRDRLTDTGTIDRNSLQLQSGQKAWLQCWFWMNRPDTAPNFEVPPTSSMSGTRKERLSSHRLWNCCMPDSCEMVEMAPCGHDPAAVQVAI